jgi:subtilase family protein/fervidolysin-like protein
MFVLCSCAVLLLLGASSRAASRHAAKADTSMAAGPGRFSRLPARRQGSHAHVRRWREFRRTAPSKTAIQQRRPSNQRLVKQGRRHGHPPPAYPARGITEQYLSSLPHRAQQTARERPLPRPVPGQILVLIDQQQPKSLGPELARTYGLERISSKPVPLLGARAELMRVRQGASHEATLAALQRDPRVRTAQPNHRYLHSGADKPRSLQLAVAGRPSLQGGDRRVEISVPQYGPDKLGLPAAHELALGRNVAIAVIDSGIDIKHPDLRGAVSRSFNAAAGLPDVTADYHGTAVAGIIRARGLVDGAAPQAEILAVRAFRVNGETALPETTTHILISAVDWAVRNGARILNMSFIGAHDPALQQALQAANQKGVVVVAAAGNGGPTAPPVYPAAYPGVIAVTAVDEADRRYEHANRGSYIAVAAPGVDILAPVERDGYAYVSGTSFAAAYVSAIAALLIERDPYLDPRSIADLLATGAEDLGPVGRDADFGAGRANALASLKLLASGLAAKRGDLAQP